MNPDQWITPAIDGEGSFTSVIGSTLDENTPLTPFYMADEKTPWTSKSTRYLTSQGYSYPEVQDVSVYFPSGYARICGLSADLSEVVIQYPCCACCECFGAGSEAL